MADLRVGRFTVGYSIRAYMAFVFATTICILTWKRVIPAEAFLVICATVIKAYFDSPKEVDSESDDPHAENPEVKKDA